MARRSPTDSILLVIEHCLKMEYASRNFTEFMATQATTAGYLDRSQATTSRILSRAVDSGLISDGWGGLGVAGDPLGYRVARKGLDFYTAHVHQSSWGREVHWALEKSKQDDFFAEVEHDFS